MLPVPVLHVGFSDVESDVTAVGMAIVLDVAAAGQRLLSLTTTLCRPLPRPVYVTPDTHAANAPLSIEHVEPGVPPENVTLMLPVPVLHVGFSDVESDVTA